MKFFRVVWIALAVFAAATLISRPAEAPARPPLADAPESWLPVDQSALPPAVADRTPTAPRD